MSSIVRSRSFPFVAALVVSCVACGGDPVDPQRYAASDRLYETVRTNIEEAADLSVVAEIDHSRLAAEAGSHMPPAHVLIFSAPELEAALLRLDPRIGLDLPLRVLAYEPTPDGSGAVIYNEYEYLSSRYGLPADGPEREMFERVMAMVLRGIDPEAVRHFERNTMSPPGMVTLESGYDFETTSQRLVEAVESQGDTVVFGVVDLPSGSGNGETVPLRMVLFGAPGPGGRAMGNGPTLGLDAFCQKLLIQAHEDGSVTVAFNDLGALAARHGVRNSIALRVIAFRLNRTFTRALDR